MTYNLEAGFVRIDGATTAGAFVTADGRVEVRIVRGTDSTGAPRVVATLPPMLPTVAMQMAHLLRDAGRRILEAQKTPTPTEQTQS
ncbi:hypothetical protein AWB91_08880 [Mycobacterium paraense]|uniref:Uncharacterized protein n=1 Tax=Mycobacterium paraense TaxID=767916 RepID=A0ABX3VT92_9MYCO|nr:hypothetical protein [Mycobacterium paraense]ORW33231.1 hypothetical protein AWB91_08880 [Mycobacterium paraense]ORW38436.1 hypothetical protein AWB88_17835 [Mycobacterium paraense]